MTTFALAAVVFSAVVLQSEAAAEKRAAGAPVVLMAGPPGAPSFVRPPIPRVAQPEAATFVVTYTGFSAAAKAAFQRALNIWSTQLSSTVPITVSAKFEPLGPGWLGFGKPNFIWHDSPSFPRPGTWYPDALANKLWGAQEDPSPDVVVTFNTNEANWHYGSGPAPAGKYDFTSVALHEIGHGLGYAASRNISSGKGSLKMDGFPLIYTLFTENAAGKALLSFPDNSTALAAQLRSGNLFFDSAQVRAANGNLRAKLYAPATFSQPSSYVHLDEATYGPGTANALMTPILNKGETNRSPGPITLAIFRTLGW